MKSLACLVVLATLGLLGCAGEERWVSLYFSSLVVRDGTVLPPSSPHSHESQLANQFEKMGIPAGRLQIRRDKEDRSVVHLYIASGALDEQQKALVKTYLVSLIQARQRANYRMSLSIPQADIEHLARRLPAAVSGLGPGVGVPESASFDARDSPSVMLLNQQSLSPYRPGDAAEQVICGLTVMLVKPTTISYSSIEHIGGTLFSSTQTPNVHLVPRTARPSASEPLVKVPAVLQVEDADLRHMLNDGGLRILFHLKPSRYTWGMEALFAQRHVTDRISFALSVIDVPHTGNHMRNYSRILQKCTREAEKLGRPFSFWFGSGLERLRYAVFWDEP